MDLGSQPGLGAGPLSQQASFRPPLTYGSDALSTSAYGEPPPTDMDVTVLAFAQWVSHTKARHTHTQQQMQAEASMIKNNVAAAVHDCADFKRHAIAIQQQMQNEIVEIRESLGSVFMEITSAVRNNAAADQEIKLKLQSLSEQTVRNETAFAQLADAADQSQSKLRAAVQEMQSSSERMREELDALRQRNDSFEVSVSERSDRLAWELEEVSQELRGQLDRRRENLKKMVNDVVSVGESLQGLLAELGEQRRSSSETQHKIQSSMLQLEQSVKLEAAQAARERSKSPTRSIQLIHGFSNLSLQPSLYAQSLGPPSQPSSPLHRGSTAILVGPGTPMGGQRTGALQSGALGSAFHMAPLHQPPPVVHLARPQSVGQFQGLR